MHTRERKPFCPEHVLHNDYARWVASLVEAASDEAVAVVKKGPSAIDLNGLIVEEIICGIAETTEPTWAGLIKDKVTYLSTAHSSAADAYFERLTKDGYISARAHPRRREVIFVSLTEKGYDLARKLVQGKVR